MSIWSRAAIMVGAACAITLAVAVSPAGAGVPPTTGVESATLTVTKVVEGNAPAGTTFTVVVDCEGTGAHELTFGAGGGAQDVVFFSPDQCDITEPDNGGARSTTGLGRIDILDPIAYARTVVNTFDPAPSSSTASTTEAAAAADTATRPLFTGDRSRSVRVGR